MSHWKFVCRPTSTEPQFTLSSSTVHHLEYLFQDFKPYLLELDIKQSTCSMQFNRRVYRTEVEGRLLANRLFNISVQGVYDPPLVYHPNSNILINEPLPADHVRNLDVNFHTSTPSTLSPAPHLSTSAAYPSTSTTRPSVRVPDFNQASPPPSPPALIKSPESTAPILSVIKISPTARLPEKRANSNSIDIFVPADVSIPPNSIHNLELGFAIIAPRFFCLKIESRLQDKNIFLQPKVAACNFYEPMVITLLNINTTLASHIQANSLLASVTCHRILPNELLLIDKNLLPSSEITSPLSPDNTSTLSDEPLIKKKSI